jgi:hypothetical protein
MPFTRAQGEAALKYDVLIVMNQPVDGPMAKSLAEAMIDNVEDLGSLIETDIENFSFITTTGEDPIASDPASIEESYEPSLPSSGIMLHRIIPSVIAGMKSRKQSLTRIALVHPSMGPFLVAPRSITLALQLPHLRMHVTPLQTSREA